MDIKTFLRTTASEERDQVAQEAGTSVAYLRQLAGRHRNCSKVLAERLERASKGRINAQAAMFPERFEFKEPA
jgi:hypothetical protein